MANVCIKIINYLLKMTERRIEHQLIQYIILLCIFFIFIPFKYRIVIMVIIFTMYFKTIKMLVQFTKLISIYRNGLYSDVYKIAYSIIYEQMTVIENFNDLPITPSIIVCNYPSELPEYALQWLLPRRVCVVVIAELREFMTRLGKDILCVEKKNSYQTLKLGIKNKINNSFIFAYINKPQSRLHKYDLGRVRTGVFYIAYELGIPITPIAIDSIDHIAGSVRNQKFQIKVGRTSIITEPIEYIKQTKKFFKDNIEYFARTKYE